MSRLFVAITPPAGAVTHLDAALTRDPGLRWVPPERWHLTLAFLGDADADDAVRGWNGRCAPVAPFEVALDGAGQFRGRVLWIGLDVPGDAWAALAADDQQPHLTVARSRQPVDMIASVEALAGYRGPPWTVTAVRMYDSHLGHAVDHGPAYELVESIPLRG